MKYLTTKQVVKEHEIYLSFKRDNETIRYLVSCAGLHPDVSPAIAELVRIGQPVELDKYLNNLLDSGRLKKYEYAKLLVAIYL